MKPLPMNEIATPAPSARPPSTGRRSASANPQRADGDAERQEELGREHVGAIPEPDAADEDQHRQPAESASVELAARVGRREKDQRERDTCDHARGVVRGERRREQAERDCAAHVGKRGMRQVRLAAERGHDEVVALRHLDGDADRRRVLRLPRIVARDPEHHPRGAQQHQPELLDRAKWRRRADGLRVDSLGDVGARCSHRLDVAGRAVPSGTPLGKGQPELPHRRDAAHAN